MPTKRDVKVTDNRSIIVEIDGVKHKLNLAEAQQLYNALGGLSGVTKQYYNPYTITYGTSTTPSNVVSINTVDATAESVTEALAAFNRGEKGTTVGSKRLSPRTQKIVDKAAAEHSKTRKAAS